MRTLAKLRYYKLGDPFLYQVSGIPIRVPVSGAILESVLCMEEHRFDRFRWPQVAARTKLKGKMDNWVTFLRYVCDVLAIRFWFCPTCIEKLINEIYRDTVKFDKSNDGESTINDMNGLKLFDLWAFAGWARTVMFLVNKNDLYAVSAIGGLMAKNRFPIPQGERSEISKRVS